MAFHLNNFDYSLGDVIDFRVLKSGSKRSLKVKSMMALYNIL